MSCTQFHSIKLFILRHAWLNLWDKHMTTGRINQVTSQRACSSTKGSTYEPKIYKYGTHIEQRPCRVLLIERRVKENFIYGSAAKSQREIRAPANYFLGFLIPFLVMRSVQRGIRGHVSGKQCHDSLRNTLTLVWANVKRNNTQIPAVRRNRGRVRGCYSQLSLFDMNTTERKHTDFLIPPQWINNRT